MTTSKIGVRHAGHGHTVNIKYGFIIFGVSVLYALLLALAHFLELRQWRRQKRPSRSSVWARINHAPFWVHTLVWAAIVVGLAFTNVHDLSLNWTVVVKRLGRLAFCLVPLDLALALRPCLLGQSYLELMPLHKWVLRLIILAGVVHGIGFFVKWTIQHQLGKAKRWANLAGIIVALFSVVLVIVSSRPVRRRFYSYFYAFHNFTVALFVLLMIWHARPGVSDFVLLSAALLLFQGALRVYNGYSVPGLTIVDADAASLRLLRLQKPNLFPSVWQPGSHIRVGLPLSSWQSWVFPAHPYTLCLSPANDTLNLVVKKGRRFEMLTSLEYRISCPYASLPTPWLSTAENVHIVCGGSGISLGIPLYEYFDNKLSVLANLHWCVSNARDTFVLSELGVNNPVNVYVTSGKIDKLSYDDADNEDAGLLGAGDNIELEPIRAEDTSNPFTDDHAVNCAEQRIKTHAGRPNLSEILASFSETDDNAHKLLIVCGPVGLIRDVRAYGDAHGIAVFSELYNM